MTGFPAQFLVDFRCGHDGQNFAEDQIAKEKETEDKKEIKQEPELLEAPAEISDADDVQLRRAIDLLKTWKVFKQLPKAG